MGLHLVDSLAAGGTADHLIATNYQLTFVFALFAIANCHDNDANGTSCVCAIRGATRYLIAHLIAR